MWNETPLHQRQFANWFLRVLADHRDWLSRRDVVARRPIIVRRSAFEVLLHKLLTPREAVTSAHREDYGRFDRVIRI